MNNQMQGVNFFYGNPFIYTHPPTTAPPLQNNQKKPQIPNMQVSQIPVGTPNLSYPMIPMIYPQQNIYPNQPIFYSNGYIPNQQPQIIYYQIVDGSGKLSPLSQVNLIPINQPPITIVKNINDNDKSQNNTNENFITNNLNLSQNGAPIQIMQMQNITQNSSNIQIAQQPIIQNQNGIALNNHIIPKENDNKVKEPKKVEKKVIFNLNNINKNKQIIKKTLNNEDKKNIENINNPNNNNLISDNTNVNDKTKKESNDNKEIESNQNKNDDLKNNSENNNIEINNNKITESNEQTDNNNISYINKDNNQAPKEPKSKIKYYRCTFKDCNKVFPKECNLKDHIRTHTGEKPYKCSYPGCHKSFSQHGNLKKHEKVHVGDKKYYCSYPNCGKKFSASYNLKIHYRCHTGERPYKCCFPGCQRSFYDKGNLKYHEKTMHLAESMEYPFSCEHMGCNAKFKTEKEKLEHHCKMEPDCLVERQELIKLVQKYKLLMNRIIKDKNIDLQKNEVIVNLRKEYEEVQSKLIDTNLFIQYLGDDFESECRNVESVQEEEEKEKEKNIINNKEEDNDDIGNENDNDNVVTEKKNEDLEKEKEKEEINNKNEIEIDKMVCENDENKDENIDINGSKMNIY